MHKISKIIGREILDSRGNPTLEADLFLSDGSFGRASVPSGASTGSYEAVELRDGGRRYGGKGVVGGAMNINGALRKALSGKEWDQKSLDLRMIALDGNTEKSRLGANAILAVSLAFAHAAAQSNDVPLYTYFKTISETKIPVLLPVPLMNVLNGGKHASGSTDFQEFMLVPLGAPSYREALRWGTEVFQCLKKILDSKGFSTAVGDEGGFAPKVSSNEGALSLILEAILKSGFTPGKDIALALDVAANELYDKTTKTYTLKTEKKELTSIKLCNLYESWVSKYPIVSIEDPFGEDDWAGYTLLTEKIGERVQIVGDDLFVTNAGRLERGIKEKAATAILIKPNQIGTVSETLDAVRIANKAKIAAILSHRSGETEDTTIAHLAVGLSSGQIKTGAPSRGERTAKYNELLRIEEELGKKAVYAGRKVFLKKAPLKKNVRHAKAK